MASQPADNIDYDLDPPISYFPAVQFDPKVTDTPPKYPETAVWGMGIRHAFPARFSFRAWPALGFADNYSIYIHDPDIFAASDVVKDITSNAYYLTVNELPEGEVEMFGRVVRADSLQESRSITQTILIKTTNPGGRDREVAKKWHSGLNMSIEGLPSGSSLNKDNTADGIWCLISKYLYIRKNDTITVKYDGISVEHIVSPEEAAGPGPIRVFISPQVIAQGSQNGVIEVVFTVRDLVGNIPEGEWVHSKRYKLISELSAALPIPIFLVDGEEFDELDLDLNSQSTLEVLVAPPRKSPKPNPPNQVTVVLTLFPDKGRSQTVRLNPVTDRNLGIETITLSYDLFTGLANGRFQVAFESYTSAGVLLGTSGSNSISVGGLPVSMPAVTVSPIEAGLIPLDTDITVTIPTYQPHGESLLETLVIETSDGRTHYTQLQPAGVQGGTRRVSKETLKDFEGQGAFQIYYITDDGEGTSASVHESSKLEVQLGDRVAVLDAPIVQGSRGNNIDPADVVDPEIQLLFPYSGTVVGDLLYWSVIGRGVQGSASGTIKINQAYAGHVLPSVFFPVDRKVVDNNINASISVSYTVVRPGQPQQVFRSQVLDLTVGPPVELGLLKILEADQALGTIEPKKVINGATLRISYKSMQAGDQIAYKWLGQYDVSQFEDVVPGDPKTNSVDVPIPAYVIAKGLRRDGNNVSVDCEVRRGQFTYTFETLSVRLLPLATLPTPRIRGFENTTVLPISLVGEEPRIDIAVWDFMREDQLMWLTCTGTFDDGTPYTEKLYTANKVVAGDLIKGVSLPFPLDKARLLKDGSIFEMKFWVSFPAIPSRQTATLFGVANYVIQQLPAVLPYPTLNGASGTTQEVTVDPVTIQNDTGVTVKYPGMLATDTITLSWIFEDGTNYQATLKGQTSGSVVFDLTAAQVLHNSVNSRVQLSYSMLRGDETTPSNVQTVMVDTIAAASLPKATINNQADGSTVDLNTFVNSRVDVGKWPLIKQGQRVWVDIIGSGKVQAVLTAYLIDSLDATNGLVNKAVRRAILTSLTLGSKFQVEVRVSYDGSTDASRAVVFPVVEYGVNDSWLYRFTDFASSNGGWAFGPAAKAPVRGGMGLFFGTPAGTPAGALITQTLNFNTAFRYRITVPVFNTSPAGTLQPIISVEVGGRVVIANTTVPARNWTYIKAEFTVPANSAASVAVINRQAGSNGNDFHIQFVELKRLT
ncbi:hypothetical protein N4P55_17350 [Pseudomonas fluorescens]|uniref:hypothetical protein n=1 Tax=Pseudomonas fluorescens TaxID=294 RepID=UPI0021D19C9A|nr:hypothetical protein [Pseudomonas fluorescens]UXV17651.1 hypothetical protein N4P55_17350 [Pseudomonas fluorescens]